MSHDASAPPDNDPPAPARFPPFPRPPPGVTIVPFKQFKPAGIRIQLDPSADGGPEVDGLGVPTIELRVKHETDENKTGAGGRKKRKKKKAGGAEEGGPVRKKTWWESWEDAEELRIMRERVDLKSPVIDRFVRAAEDFKTSRSWPPQALGINSLWDTFRLYTGLLTNQPTLRKTKTFPAIDTHEDYSDDEEEFDAAAAGAAWDDAGGAQETVNAGEHLEEDDGNPRDSKLRAFLDDPELSMKIFFSSHMREKGLIWSQPNLTNMPRLISFFLNFVLRNSVLPTHAAALERALAVVAQAAIELPLTSKVGQTLPDDFSEGCRELWGSKSLGLCIGGVEETGPAADDSRDSGGAGEEEPEEDRGQGRKKRKIAPAQGIDALKEKAFISELEAGNLLVDPNAAVALGQAKEVLEDAGMDVDGGGWGTGGWDNDDNGWAAVEPEKKEGEDGEVLWMQQPTTDGWDAPVLKSLTTFLGPTALPLTHETGLVEWSLRRVKAVLDGPKKKDEEKKSKSKSKGRKETETNAEAAPIAASSGKEGVGAVEEELSRRFGRVVLEPWLGWDRGGESDISTPSMLPSSCAPLPDAKQTSHDPLKDEIVVLVQADVVSSGIITPGMGLGATWIQIARKRGLEGSPGAVEYWYMEQLMAIFPSYYTQPESAV